MSVALFIGFLALVLAGAIVGSAVRKHQRDIGSTTTWDDVREAFTGDAIRDVRTDSAFVSDPDSLESDVGVGEIFEYGEEGSGYLTPRDILAPRGTRN